MDFSYTFATKRLFLNTENVKKMASTQLLQVMSNSYAYTQSDYCINIKHLNRCGNLCNIPNKDQNQSIVKKFNGKHNITNLLVQFSKKFNGVKNACSAWYFR